MLSSVVMSNIDFYMALSQFSDRISLDVKRPLHSFQWGIVVTAAATGTTGGSSKTKQPLALTHCRGGAFQCTQCLTWSDWPTWTSKWIVKQWKMYTRQSYSLNLLISIRMIGSSDWSLSWRLVISYWFKLASGKTGNFFSAPRQQSRPTHAPVSLWVCNKRWAAN